MAKKLVVRDFWLVVRDFWLVVRDFWLVVNGDWASCKSQVKIASCTTEKYNLKVTYNNLCAHVCSLNLLQGFG